MAGGASGVAPAVVGDRGIDFGVGIFQELRCLFSRWERADHVQVGPAHKHAIGAHPSGSDPQLFQPAEDQFVNPALGHRIGVSFKGTDR